MREGPSFEPGFRFPDRTVAIAAGYQRERLTASGVDPSVWGDVAEPVLWALEGFRSMTAVGQDIDGYVHVEQRLRVAAPVTLGQPATFRGSTLALDPAPRGRHLVQRFEAVRGDGGVAVIAEHVGLIPDPARMGAAAAVPAAQSSATGDGSGGGPPAPAAAPATRTASAGPGATKPRRKNTLCRATGRGMVGWAWDSCAHR